MRVAGTVSGNGLNEPVVPVFTTCGIARAAKTSNGFA
jgi:hypothetical protein